MIGGAMLLDEGYGSNVFRYGFCIHTYYYVSQSTRGVIKINVCFRRAYVASCIPLYGGLGFP